MKSLRKYVFPLIPSDGIGDLTRRNALYHRHPAEALDTRIKYAQLPGYNSKSCQSIARCHVLIMAISYYLIPKACIPSRYAKDPARA